MLKRNKKYTVRKMTQEELRRMQLIQVELLQEVEADYRKAIAGITELVEN